MFKASLKQNMFIVYLLLTKDSCFAYQQNDQEQEAILQNRV